jgi:hypothetical protein
MKKGKPGVFRFALFCVEQATGRCCSDLLLSFTQPLHNRSLG